MAVSKTINISYNNEIKQAEIILGQYWLEFNYLDIHIRKEEVGRSPFYLLLEVRKELDPQNIYILCAGSRYDFWARGMRKGYFLRLGKPASLSDLVSDCFDPVEDGDVEKIKTVAAQEKYYKQWCDYFSEEYNKRLDKQ